MLSFNRIKEGEFTKTVYTLIKEQKYREAIEVLNSILESNSGSRAGLSLLGHCYFYTQDYVNASECYQQLTNIVPGEVSYKFYLAQSLYQACLYDEAMKVIVQINEPELEKKVTQLKAAIKYGEGDIAAAKGILDNTSTDDLDTEIYHGCVLYKEERYEEALEKLSASMMKAGYSANLSYNIALCYYQLKEYAPALKHIGDIIERGIRQHPELSVGMATEGIEVRSVGNTLTLHETALIEAFNLKSAIEYQLKNLDAAREALTDMPPRSEEELDAVTLHNQALMNMDTNPSEGFEKLQFLLQQNPYPPETFWTLLQLYCKYEYYDLAADVLAENTHLTYKYLTPYLYEFLDALITRQTSPEEAYRKFDEIASKHTETLRKLTKQVQEARQSRDDEAVKKAVTEYESTLERYIPVLMAQAKIYWDMENYSQVENIFRKSAEFCNDNDVWKLNVAHVLFMQENKFKECTGFYEPIVKKNYDNILNVSAVVLANLCVSYIMTSQNEEAEELMRKIEKEEEQVSYEDADKKLYHLCIVNLVIGTLYCSKGNFEFGISRIIKSLEPYNKKLGTDTWFYAKRCFLSLFENLSKHMIVVKDTVLQECLQFLDQCEIHGRNVKTVLDNPLDGNVQNDGKNTVTYEVPKNYAFSYSVKDVDSGDDFSHSQAHNGKATRGQYRVRLPDGRIQVVSYTADHKGYRADVQYEEESKVSAVTALPLPIHRQNLAAQTPTALPDHKPNTLQTLQHYVRHRLIGQQQQQVYAQPKYIYVTEQPNRQQQHSYKFVPVYARGQLEFGSRTTGKPAGPERFSLGHGVVSTLAPHVGQSSIYNPDQYLESKLQQKYVVTLAPQQQQYLSTTASPPTHYVTSTTVSPQYLTSTAHPDYADDNYISSTPQQVLVTPRSTYKQSTSRIIYRYVQDKARN